jgi:hypothetical protein
MKHIISITLFFFITIILAGCMPLKQNDIVASSNPDFYVRYDEGYLRVVFDGVLAKKGYEIIDEKTFLTDPNNNIFSTYHKVTDFGTQLFIKDGSGKTIHSWSNGIWMLYLSARDKNGQVDIYRLDIKLWTLYYNPFIHGAPN